MIDLGPLWLTFKLALITTLVLFLISIPLSYWLSTGKSFIKTITETLVSMPIVLPPTVLGFYLLIAFSPQHATGKWLLQHFDIKLVFSFTGLVVASLVYSLPFMVHPILSGLRSLPTHLTEASYLLGKSKWQTLIYVLLPNIKKAIYTGLILCFAHTVGEFGVVLMIGGNIPNETKVASIAIYDHVEAMHYKQANLYSMILFAITFIILLTVHSINSGYFKRLRS